MSMFDPAANAAKFARTMEGAAANRKRMEDENAERCMFVCPCGRGFVTTIFGCSTCNAEASDAFVASMMEDKPKKR